MTFTIPDEPVSLNVSFNQHWSVRSKRNHYLADTVFALAYNVGWRPSMPKFRRVKITICGWRGDYDNAIAGCKPIVDALWKNDIIEGDNPKQCEITYAFKKGKGKRVEIELEAK